LEFNFESPANDKSQSAVKGAHRGRDRRLRSIEIVKYFKKILDPTCMLRL